MRTIVIGERLNSSNRKIRSMLESGDLKPLLDIADAQIAAGAEYIDLNTSLLMERELEALLSTGAEIRKRSGAKISVDSPDPGVLVEGSRVFGADCIVNSITCDDEPLGRVLPAVSSAGSAVIVLLKDKNGIPAEAGGRLKLAEKAFKAAAGEKLPPEKIFFDPVFSPVATEKKGLAAALDTLRMLKESFPGSHRIGGLSNISFGLPLRKLLNRTFLSMAVSHGLDAVICDPTDEKLMEALRASEAVAGLDPGCRGFLSFFRSSAK